MIVKHDCIEGPDARPCDIDQVQIHFVFLEWTGRQNEVYINTHYDLEGPPFRAMYYKDLPSTADPLHFGFINQVPFPEYNENYEEFGDTWILDQVNCQEKICPYRIRAGEQPHKGFDSPDSSIFNLSGWKRDEDHVKQGTWLAFEEIDENDDNFLWFVFTKKDENSSL